MVKDVGEKGLREHGYAAASCRAVWCFHPCHFAVAGAAWIVALKQWLLKKKEEIRDMWNLVSCQLQLSRLPSASHSHSSSPTPRAPASSSQHLPSSSSLLWSPWSCCSKRKRFRHCLCLPPLLSPRPVVLVPGQHLADAQPVKCEYTTDACCCQCACV